MAIEFYQPNLFNVLNSIDLRKLHDKLKTSAIEEKEYYYALVPSILSEIYPPILLTPLIACSKEASIKDIESRIAKLDSEKIIEEYSNDVAKELINNNHVNNMDLIILPSNRINDESVISLIKHKLIKGKSVIIIPIPPYEQNPEFTISNLRSLWQKYIDAGLIDVIYPGARTSLFLLGLLYNRIINCRNSSSTDLHIYGQFSKALVDLLLNTIKEMSSRKIQLSDDVISKLEDTWSRAYSIGLGKSKYLLLIAGSTKSNRNILESFLTGSIDDINKVIENALKLVHVMRKFIPSAESGAYESDLAKGFSSLLKEGIRYYNDLKTGYDNIVNLITKSSVIDIVSELLKEYTANDKNLASLVDNVQKNIVSKVTNISSEPVKYLIAWEALQLEDEGQQNKCELGDLRDKLQEIIQLLEGLRKDIDDVINDIKEYSPDSYLIKVLRDLRNSAEDFYKSLREMQEEYIDECPNRITGLSKLEAELVQEFIYLDLIKSLIDNMNKLKEHIGDLRDYLHSLLENLRDISMLTKEAVEALNSNEPEAWVNDDLRDILNGNLQDIKGSLNDLSDDLKRLIDEANKVKSPEIEELMSRIKEKARRLREVVSSGEG